MEVNIKVKKRNLTRRVILRIQHPLKFELYKRGIKQIDMCFEMGLSLTLISYYLNGTRPMPDATKEKIENYIKEWDEKNGKT